jgi:hypothetical protein
MADIKDIFSLLWHHHSATAEAATTTSASSETYLLVPARTLLCYEHVVAYSPRLGPVEAVPVGIPVCVEKSRVGIEW